MADLEAKLTNILTSPTKRPIVALSCNLLSKTWKVPIKSGDVSCVMYNSIILIIIIIIKKKNNWFEKLNNEKNFFF